MEIAAEVWSRVGPKATGTDRFGGEPRRHGTCINRTWIFPHLQVSGRFLPNSSAPPFQASYGEVSLSTPLFLFFPFTPPFLFALICFPSLSSERATLRTGWNISANSLHMSWACILSLIWAKLR